MMTEDSASTLHDSIAPNADLSTLLITLLKAVIYREDDTQQWNALLNLQAQLRDHLAVLGLELLLDEAEGYAFVKSRADSGAEESMKLPRLIARRPLSFPVSLLLALLRKKLAEFDAIGSDTRLVLSRDDIVELVRVFLPDSSNETRLIDQIEMHINKIVDLGFLRRMKTQSSTAAAPANYEVRRILKAFIDSQWLTDFDARLTAYQVQLAGTAPNTTKDGITDE